MSYGSQSRISFSAQLFLTKGIATATEYEYPGNRDGAGVGSPRTDTFGDLMFELVQSIRPPSGFSWPALARDCLARAAHH